MFLIQSRRHNNKLPTFFVIFEGPNINALMRKQRKHFSSLPFKGEHFFPRIFQRWAFIPTDYSQMGIISPRPFKGGKYFPRTIQRWEVFLRTIHRWAFFPWNNQKRALFLHWSNRSLDIFQLACTVICCLCAKLLCWATYLPTTNTFQFCSFCAELSHQNFY